MACGSAPTCDWTSLPLAWRRRLVWDASTSAVLVDLIVGHDINEVNDAILYPMDEAIPVVHTRLVVVLLRFDWLDPHAGSHLALHDREGDLVSGLLLVRLELRVALLELISLRCIEE
jgi:hypothetical protein